MATASLNIRLSYNQGMYLEALNNQNYSEITKYKPLIINTF